MIHTELDEVVDALNMALDNDPDAMQSLFAHRVPCNRALADHPTIEVGCGDDGDEPFDVGLLGIINGCLRTAGIGTVAARYTMPYEDGTSPLVGFVNYDRTTAGGCRKLGIEPNGLSPIGDA
jgi:hypothetical protein